MTAAEVASHSLGVRHAPLVGAGRPETLDLADARPVALEDVASRVAATEVVQRQHVGDAVATGEVTHEVPARRDIPALLRSSPQQLRLPEAAGTPLIQEGAEAVAGVLVERDYIGVPVVAGEVTCHVLGVLGVPLVGTGGPLVRGLPHTRTVAGEYEDARAVVTVAVEGEDVVLAVVTGEVADDVARTTTSPRVGRSRPQVLRRADSATVPLEEEGAELAVAVVVQADDVGVVVVAGEVAGVERTRAPRPLTTACRPQQLRLTEAVGTPLRHEGTEVATGVVVEGETVGVPVVADEVARHGVAVEATPAVAGCTREVRTPIGRVRHPVLVGVGHGCTAASHRAVEVDEVARPVRLPNVEPLQHGRAAVVVLADVDVAARDSFDVRDVPGRSVGAHFPDGDRSHGGVVVDGDTVARRVVVPVWGVAEVARVGDPVLPQPVGGVIGAVVPVGVHRVAPGPLPRVARVRHAVEAGRLPVRSARDVVGLSRPRHAHNTDSREGCGDEEHEETPDGCYLTASSHGTHPSRV